MDQASAPKPGHTPDWVLVDFDTAVVAAGPTAGSHVLTVTGETGSDGELSLGVRLVAAKKYLTQPEYAEIEVRWDRADAIFQVITPYTATAPLDGIRGSKGVEVVGESKSQKIDVP